MIETITGSPPVVVGEGDAPDRRLASVMLRAAGVVRTFGGHAALHGVDLELRRGEIIGLLGPNGAGKTTLLRVLGGLADPTSGTVEVLGRPLPGLDDRGERRPVGLVPSGDRTFYLRLSGRENLMFFARMHGMAPRQARQRCDELLDVVGLGDAARRRVGQYSHGMHKRLAVARALLRTPAVLLVDEATHDLDPEGADQVRRLVASVAASGAGVIWATQRLEELTGFATGAIVLTGGRVRYSGSVDGLLDQAPRRRYVLTLDARVADLAALQHLTGNLAHVRRVPTTADRVLADMPATTALSDLFAAVTAAGYAVRSCREEGSEMLEAFIHVTRPGVQP